MTSLRPGTRLPCLLWAAFAVRPAEAFDPIGLATKGVTLLLMLLVSILVLTYRHRVLYLLTGDANVHADVHSVLWQSITCCRMCTGEWTKYISALLCFWVPSMRGRNLKRMFAQAAGILPVPVRITNIIVGDLPASGTGDFYVAIEVGDSPMQITSVAEDSAPKVVQFEETLIIRVRHSPMSRAIRISVRELHTFGNTELCECYISPLSIAQWRYRQTGPIRIRMEPLNRSLHFSFAPWILMELMAQPEMGTPEAFRVPSRFEVEITDTVTGKQTRVTDAKTFKQQYRLVNRFGYRAEEPDEEKVGALDDARRMKSACLTHMCLAFLALLSLFFLVRYYCYACFAEYEKVAVLDNFDLDFPVEASIRDHYLGKCGKDGSALMAMMSRMGQDTLSKAHRGVREAHRAALNRSVGLSAEVREQSGFMWAARKAEADAKKRIDETSDLTAERLGTRLTPDPPPPAAAEKAEEDAREHTGEARNITKAAGTEEEDTREHIGETRNLTKVQRERLLCHPAPEEVVEVCDNVPFGAATPQLWLGVGEFGVSLQCQPATCHSFRTLRRFNLVAVCLAVGWLAAFLALKRGFDMRLTHLGASMADEG